MIKIIYTFFLGLLLALFVGMGIQAFYPAPQPPTFPSEPTPVTKPINGPDSPAPTETESQRQARINYQEQQKTFETSSKFYNRNVSIIALICAILLLVISLTAASKIDVISDGILLGGVFILFYSIGRSFGSDDTKYQFIVITAGLIIAFILGYLKFIKPNETGSK